MVHERVRRLDVRGFTLTEILVVVAIIGVLAVVSAPMFWSYYRSSALKGASQEVTTLLNGARQLAIRQNTTVCVGAPAAYGTQVQYYTNATCTAPTWKGPGTDGNGNMTLSNSMQLKQIGGTAVTFTYLGAASASVTFRVCNPQNTSQHAEVTVVTSGRITTAYLSTAC